MFFSLTLLTSSQFPTWTKTDLILYLFMLVYEPVPELCPEEARLLLNMHWRKVRCVRNFAVHLSVESHAYLDL